MEGNELIARFMYPEIFKDMDKYGDEFKTRNISKYLEMMNGDYTLTCLIGSRSWEELDYDNSWDWIMPVVAKLKIATNDPDFLERIHVRDDTIDGMQLEHKMDMTFKCDYISVGNTYKAVINFIKWYNKHAS